jgi:hypothetical protein
MHAWDQPAEELLALGPKTGARLVMPRLGEAFEPAHGERLQPWWRAVDSVSTPRKEDPAESITIAKPLSFPID